ncbi:hypothetical protein F5884DRAFT_855850 [Xylogone sp. PMI_703]|nr:hypothetical protein F5884DRAFT_855850 [Xylogone sp. PMI_703]
MNEALCSILSGEDEWCFHTEGRYIKFNRDGTGELWCRLEFVYFIAVEIKWKSIKPPDPVKPPSQIVEPSNAGQNKGPKLLGQLDLEITLVKQLPQWARDSNLSKSTILNELSLTEDAFQPKLYTIRIEKGNFTEPCYVGYQGSYKPRFALRIVFEKSPYPPRAEWKKPEGGPDANQFWDHTEFVSRRSPELDKQGRAMNDIPSASWNSCAIS